RSSPLGRGRSLAQLSSPGPLESAFSSPLVTHKPPDERVILRMRIIAVCLLQQKIKSMLRCSRQAFGNGQPDLPQARCTDGDQERLDRFTAMSEIVESLFDEIFTRLTVHCHYAG